MSCIRIHPLHLIALFSLLVAGLFTAIPVLAQVTYSSSGGGATFEGLGAHSDPFIESGAQGLSADGMVVVGTASINITQGPYAFRWESGKMDNLGTLGPNLNNMDFSTSLDVSTDGSVIVGYSTSPGVIAEAFRWENGVMEGLGFLEGGFIDVSEARGISADGTVIVGISFSEAGIQAFRWEDGVMEGLGTFGAVTSYAWGVSGDGSVIVGWYGEDVVDQEAFRWEDGEMIGLGMLPGGDSYSIAHDISTDGSVIVGVSSSEQGNQAFRWENGEMTGLGFLIPAAPLSTAAGVSADGSVIVGFSETPGTHFDMSAMIWTEAEGMRNLQDMLENDYGLNLDGWHLANASAISDDGRVIVGWGRSPNPNSLLGFEAWRVVLPASDVPEGPENDHIADATIIPVANATYAGTNVNATLEDGEPEPSCTFGDWTTNYSVWWTFTADAESNRVNIDTFGSDFDTILSLHHADDLSEVACDDDTDGLQSQIEDASIVAGETYLIRVAGYDQSGANQGDIQLTAEFHWVSGEDGPNEIAQGLTHPSPNPVREMASFMLAVDRGQQVTVEVFDMMGRRVQTLYEGSLAAGATENLTLDASRLPSGVYVIRALGEDFVDTQRVTVVR